LGSTDQEGTNDLRNAISDISANKGKIGIDSVSEFIDEDLIGVQGSVLVILLLFLLYKVT